MEAHGGKALVAVHVVFGQWHDKASADDRCESRMARVIGRQWAWQAKNLKVAIRLTATPLVRLFALVGRRTTFAQLPTRCREAATAVTRRDARWRQMLGLPAAGAPDNPRTMKVGGGEGTSNVILW